MPALRAAVARHDPPLLVLCSPNNPTGSAIGREDLGRLLSETGGLVLVDEAYGEFHDESALDLLDAHPNLLLLKTLSKVFGAAGIRVGYLLAHPEVAAEVLKAKLPFDVNVFSRVAALALLRRADLVRERAAFIAAERDRLFERLRTVPGVVPYPSCANLILFEVEEDPRRVFEQLAERGVLIRNVSLYPRLRKALRVSIGTREENDRFLEALRGVVESG